MIKIKQYPKYKESGIEWIGKIPKHWTTTLIQECYEYRNEKVSDKYYPPLSVTKKGVVPQLENAAKTDAHDNRKKVLKGDFAINSRSDRKGSCGVSNYDGSVSLIYHVLKPRNKQIENFSHSLFKDIMFSEEFYKWGHGIVDDLWTTQYPEMKKISIPLPPVDEIDIISKNLDRITCNLNNQITKNKKLIELLKEKRTSLINQAVTKGLNPNTPMKESGIEWIGKIPEHWDISKLKYYTLTNSSALSDNTPKDYEFEYVDIGSVSLENGIEKYEKMNFENSPSRARRVVNENDIIISTVRTYLKAIAVISNKENVIVSTGFAVLTPKNINYKYLGYFVKSEYFTETVTSKSVGVSYPAINSSELNNIQILIPSIEEQIEISSYLDKENNKINKTIEKIERNIELLEEYKESLIHHVVTGKVDVRGVEV